MTAPQQLQILYHTVVPSLEDQTGWKRTYPQMICQDPDLLSKVNVFTYNLNDAGFVKYFISRRGVKIDGEEPLLTDPKAEQRYLASDDIRYIGTGQPVPMEDRLVTLKVYRIMRGQLQDCWELYCAYKNPSAVAMQPWECIRCQ